MESHKHVERVATEPRTTALDNPRRHTLGVVVGDIVSCGEGVEVGRGFDGHGYQNIGSFPKEAREKRLDAVDLEVPYAAPEMPRRAVLFPLGNPADSTKPVAG